MNVDDALKYIVEKEDKKFKLSRSTKQTLLGTLQRMAGREEITVWDEVNKILYSPGEISFCMNGDSIQINVKDNLTLSERIIKGGNK